MPRESIPSEGSCSILLRNVPKELRARFKKYCIDKEVSMEAQLIRLIKKCVAQKEA